MIDSENVFLSAHQKTQIASEAGNNEAHGLSIGENLKNISDTKQITFSVLK